MAASRLGWIVIASVAGLLAAGFAVYFAVNAGGSPGGQAGVAPPAATTPLATTPPAIDTPTETAPAPTEAPTATEPPPEISPTPDTRVPMIAPPTIDQIQLGPDGKYFVADRGDGCAWVEALRRTSRDLGEEVILRTDCPADFQILYRLETGETFIEMS